MLEARQPLSLGDLYCSVLLYVTALVRLQTLSIALIASKQLTKPYIRVAGVDCSFLPLRIR
jgi:hypothetical protein